MTENFVKSILGFSILEIEKEFLRFREFFEMFRFFPTYL